MLPKRFVYPSPGFFSEYWSYGTGKKMLKKLDSIPTRESIEEDGKLLLEYDVIGDRVIKEVFEKMGFHKASQLIDDVLNKGIDFVKDVPEPVQQLFAQADTIPDWLDQDLLKTGAGLCGRGGTLALMVLRNYCLMGGYESSAINKPLIYTQALKKGAAKRMAETLEFWVNVTGENAMRRDSIGFKSAIKVRLMHAYARTAVERTPGWSNDLWGIPINQGDMVAGNLAFSLAFMEGLKIVGTKISEKEIKGVLHLWKYIGYIMGIPPAYLPDTEKQAIESLYKWTITQSAADEDTQALAHALMLEPLTSSYANHLWQKKLLVKIHLAYNHFFLGKRACKTMALPNTILKYYPYSVAVINSLLEFLVPHKNSVTMGRKWQERIKTLYLRGYEHHTHPAT
jgi:hypothetical protein